MMKSYCFIFYVLLLLYSILASAATEVTIIDNNSENIKPAIQQEEDRMPLISGSHLLVMISWVIDDIVAQTNGFTTENSENKRTLYNSFQAVRWC